MASLEFGEALVKLLEVTKPKSETIVVPLDAALGKILAEDIAALRNLPPYNNSALDGYAIKYADSGKRLHIYPTTIFAGVSVEASLKKDECYKIMTGAKIPDDADTIVRFEDSESDGEFVQIPQNVKKNDGFRVKGEECKAGESLISKGVRLNPSHIALLAAQGIGQLRVYAKPKVCVLSSGNELKEPYESASEDQFYNVNSYAIIALLHQVGFEADYGGIIPDDLEKTARFFGSLKGYDVVISSGGVSAGEADYIEDALAKNGFEAIFTSIKLKPGKPTTCGLMDKTLVLSMPGNPLSAFINTYLFALPVLRKLSNETEFLHKKIKVPNAEAFKLKGERANVVSGRLEDGRFVVTNGGKINSGMIFPLSKSNAIIITTRGKDIVEKDEIVEVYKLY